MAYEGGFLNKCKSLANSLETGGLPLADFAVQVRAMATKKKEDAVYLRETYESKENRTTFPKAVDLGEQGLREFEEGFRCWMSYIEDQPTPADVELIRRGLAAFDKGNECMNQSRDNFLLASEEDPLLWVF